MDNDKQNERLEPIGRLNISEQMNLSGPDKRGAPSGLGAGLIVGIAIGAGLGAMLDNIGIGVGIGIALGLTFDVIKKKPGKDKNTTEKGGSIDNG